jgi:hypothetical protein
MIIITERDTSNGRWGRVDSKHFYDLAKYLHSLSLVMGTERGQEHYIPYFKLQRSRFSNGVDVTVNLGPVEHALPDGTSVGRYGFRIKLTDGQIVAGQFQDLAITKESTITTSP